MHYKWSEEYGRMTENGLHLHDGHLSIVPLLCLSKTLRIVHI